MHSLQIAFMGGQGPYSSLFQCLLRQEQSVVPAHTLCSLLYNALTLSVLSNKQECQRSEGEDTRDTAHVNVPKWLC